MSLDNTLNKVQRTVPECVATGLVDMCPSGRMVVTNAMGVPPRMAWARAG